MKREGAIIFSPIEPFAGLKQALSISRGDVIAAIRASEIKGRGGAGFPTGVKWNLAAAAVSDKKFVVCNADEGEPGTFKDRVLLNEYSRLVFEGMIIAGYAVGAQEGIIYLRGEYAGLLPSLGKILLKLRRSNVLGVNVLGKEGFNFDIRIESGAGAYVCGEETALIESLEGNRGEPRSRPPFPVNTGYLGQPTVVNNVETCAAVPHIIVKGADWFKSFGTEKSRGSKLISVSGDCGRPGVYEVPFGTSVAQILAMAGAKGVKAVQVGGASGVCVTPAQFDRKIAYEDLSSGGSFMVFGKSRKMLDAAVDFLEFFSEESCGQCTPCREGVPVLLDISRKIRDGRAAACDIEALESLAETMQDAAKCGLGQSAPNALLAILKNFPGEYEVHDGQARET